MIFSLVHSSFLYLFNLCNHKYLKVIIDNKLYLKNSYQKLLNDDAKKIINLINKIDNKQDRNLVLNVLSENIDNQEQLNFINKYLKKAQ